MPIKWLIEYLNILGQVCTDRYMFFHLKDSSPSFKIKSVNFSITPPNPDIESFVSLIDIAKMILLVWLSLHNIYVKCQGYQAKYWILYLAYLKWKTTANGFLQRFLWDSHSFSGMLLTSERLPWDNQTPLGLEAIAYALYDNWPQMRNNLRYLLVFLLLAHILWRMEMGAMPDQCRSSLAWPCTFANDQPRVFLFEETGINRYDKWDKNNNESLQSRFL